MKEIPKYALRAYALLHTKFGYEQPFAQDSLDWVVSTAMKKKIFAILLDAGWIKKVSKRRYVCVNANVIFSSLFAFKVPEVLSKAERAFCYTGMSAVEIWSDFTYIQRSWEHSPYFIKIQERDIQYWKEFLSEHGIHFFINEGTFIGEFIILIPEKTISCVEHEGMPVDPLEDVIAFCEHNSLFAYPLSYIQNKYAIAAKEVG